MSQATFSTVSRSQTPLFEELQSGSVTATGVGIKEMMEKTAVSELATTHRRLHGELKASRFIWSILPDGPERDRAAQRNYQLSTEMMLLRDAGRRLLGIDWEDDTNPFYDDEDF